MGALIIYTSGTTGRPKGALHTHASLGAQIASLVGAWEWAETDRIVHPLPLHHIHGIVNALLCPHAVGAAVEFVPKFSPSGLWARLRGGAEGTAPPVTVFMGVPTMYVRLLQALESTEPAERAAAAAAAKALRLTVSGSAACPVPLMNAWEGVTGQRLLERYGMTEVGMVLSNPLHGERRPGFVGTPLPGVRIKVTPDAPADAAAAAGAPESAVAAVTGEEVSVYGPVEEGPGELRVAGAAMFAGYWGKPAATAESYDEDGFFRTGDTVVRQGGAWRILGRTSVDIIKCGGYKLSALEIEAHLLEHPRIGEAAVVGLPDEAYGQVVAAVLAPKASGEALPTLAELRVWARDVMAPYKVPAQLRTVDAIPRNAMGKVNKKELAKARGEGALVQLLLRTASSFQPLTRCAPVHAALTDVRQGMRRSTPHHARRAHHLRSRCVRFQYTTQLSIRSASLHVRQEVCVHERAACERRCILRRQPTREQRGAQRRV
jgi:malonyl-CoA/methylmalonyl-CoA synthetase